MSGTVRFKCQVSYGSAHFFHAGVWQVRQDRGTTIAYRCETAGLGALEEDGRLVHEQLIQTECDSDVVVGNRCMQNVGAVMML